MQEAPPSKVPVQSGGLLLEELPDNQNVVELNGSLRPVDGGDEYMAATDIQRAEWSAKGEIGIGEWYDRFHKGVEAVPWVNAVSLAEPAELAWKAKKLAENDYGPGEQEQRQKDFDQLLRYKLIQEEIAHRGTSISADILHGITVSTGIFGELLGAVGLAILTAPAGGAGGVAAGGATVAKLGAKEAGKIGLRQYIKGALEGGLKESLKRGAAGGLGAIGKAAAVTGTVSISALASATSCFTPFFSFMSFVPSPETVRSAKSGRSRRTARRRSGNRASRIRPSPAPRRSCP